MKKVIPTCRYGHGELKRMDELIDGKPTGWGLLAYYEQQGVWATQPDYVWTTSVYRCSTCRYIELFDWEIPRNAATQHSSD